MSSTARLPVSAKDGRANLLRAFKATGCAVCGVRYPEVDWSELHIDHIDPRDKPRSGSSLRGSTPGLANHSGTTGSGAIATMLAELLLCQVLCHGCHRKKHRGQITTGAQLPLFNGNGSWHYAQ